MGLLETQLHAAFDGADYGAASTDWYRSHGYSGRNWDGLCMGVVNWAVWFTTGGEPDWFDSATIGWDNSPQAYTMDPYAAVAGDVLWFKVAGLADGHTMLALGGGRFLHAHSLLQEVWGDHLGVVDYNWFKSQRSWYTLLGITRTVGQYRVDITPAVALPPAPVGQRTVGWAEGVTIRSGATSASASKGERGTGWSKVFTEFVYGQDPYGTGKNVWFKDGDDYYYSDAFTDPTTVGLNEYKPPVVVTPPVKPPVALPDPEEPTTPVEPPVVPEVPADPTEPPVVEPEPELPTTPITPTPHHPTKEDIMTLQSTIPSVEVEGGALGSIVEDTNTRKKIYSVWIVIGLILQALGAGAIAGYAAAIVVSGWGWPVWAVGGIVLFAVVAGAYAALSPQVAVLARANPTPPPAIVTVDDPEAKN